ncbi:FG-GAP-like repeat-containing protein [Flavobacterium sp.]|uniref:FG-GAP-like repeat-containing protein n=1 Tax=Flavobacterium sp. TaxID=239 RepID=UPI0012178EEF|nr:FG-GAP-like repeat-containing protein [Flavobacterium sp.]RZJ70495.1 MAG: T9SS type A sorting domain-containing protein [Flavobacterium sp.]
MDWKTTKIKASFWVGTFLLCCITLPAFAQNSCATAVAIGPGTYTVDAVNGTINTGSMCTNSNNANAAKWYKYTPTANYTVTVTSDLQQNICKDTYLAIYTGTCAGLTCFAYDDDAGVIQCNSGNTSSFLSKKTFDVAAGTTYYISWDNRWMSTGFDFQLTEAPYVPSPCITATTVTPGTYTVNAIDGTNINTTCSTATLAKWYKFIPSADANVTVTSDLSQNLCKDTNFSVYTGSCTGTLTCVTSDDDSGILTCNSGNTNSFLSKKTFTVTGGTTYYIVWDNKKSAVGFDFQIIQQEIVYPVQYVATPIATVNSGYNMCIVDMNGDGKDDIAGVSQNNLRIHYQGNAGALTYTDFPITGNSMMPSWSIAAGDYNKDGYTDLLLGAGSGLTFWRSNNTGTAYTNVTPGQYIFCQRTNFVDLNADGNLDAFSCHDVDDNCYYMNDGTGNLTFGQVSGTNSYGQGGGNYATIWTDYNNDGLVDLFISKCSGPPCQLRKNNGNGVFTDVSSVSGLNFTPVSSWSSAVADFDNDGDMDILVGSNGGSPTRLYRNELGSGAPDMFTNITLASGYAAGSPTGRDYIAYDFDNDGFVDVMGGGNRIMFNQHDSSFLPSIYSGLGVGAVGDLNGDGFLDIQNGNTIRYAVPNGNNWTKITLQGVQSNKQGIGARVEIYGAWGKQIRDIRSGEGFGYMSTLNAHFGLGQATAITQVIIRWPSGTVDVVQNPPTNTALNVVEGSTLAVNQNQSNVFTMYPNPTQDILNISGEGVENINFIRIFDLLGRTVASPTLEQQTLSVRDLTPGTYVVLIRTSDGKTFSQKFIKK